MAPSFYPPQPAEQRRSFNRGPELTVQRCGGSCSPEGCAHQDLGELQRRPIGQGRSIEPGTAPAVVHEALGTPWLPLDGGTRARMQHHFGHDIGDVRIHTDARAAASARAVNALAYTMGRDLVFGEGQYQPGTPAGRQLLAHEITHVLQQRNTTSRPTPGQPLALDANAAAEQEARQVGAQAPTAAAIGATGATEQVARVDPMVVGNREHQPQAPVGRGSLGHEMAHVVQRQAGPPLQRQAAADATQMSITPAYAAGLSDEALVRQAQLVYSQINRVPLASPAYAAVYQNLVILLQEAQKRPSLQTGRAIPGSRSRMLPRLLEWKAAGLLDPPFRPPDVPPFPPFPVTPEQAAGINQPAAAAPIAAGMLAPLPGLPAGGLGPSMPPGGFAPLPGPPAGGLGPAMPPGGFAPPAPPVEIPLEPMPPVEVPVVEPIPVPGPGPGVGPGPGAAPLLRVVPVAVFFTVLLWPSETAPPWMDEMNPITGDPYGSPEDYHWTARLAPEQADYLRRLDQARREMPDPALEEDPAPWDVPQVEPRPDEEEDEDKRRRRKCLSKPIRRRGGHARHDAYATKVTGSGMDYYMKTPFNLAIAYDGQGRALGLDVWEVKVGFGWFFNPALAGLRDLTLRRFDAQMSRGVVVAYTCGYFHLWSIPDRWVAQLLNARWGGLPPVLSIPE